MLMLPRNQRKIVPCIIPRERESAKSSRMKRILSLSLSLSLFLEERRGSVNCRISMLGQRDQ